ncbi:MAG TPA: SDR family NAD(P)-dependent oxidoreductase [Sporichthya sp.]|nr:SDR family NAD(P)-dependent oxidoreductase [Sporichthya sp.]
MDIAGNSVLVTGGASGLGLGTARALAKAGAKVTILDLENSAGVELAAEIGGVFVAADVTNTEQVEAALDAAEAQGPLRAVVHCAGRGGPVRLVEKDGTPGSLETYTAIVNVNLIGTFNVLRLAAARMARSEPVDGERGVCILTASVAAYEGQIGQIPYTSSKAGIVGMTIVAARDLATKQIRVCTIAPGLFDTPLLARLPEEVKASLGKSVPHPSRLGTPDEFAKLALHIVDNPMLNGETIRLDGAIRMAPR